MKKQTKIKNFLLIGPFPEPISGVSLANKVVKEGLMSSKQFKIQIINTSYPYFDENVGGFSSKKMLFFLSINIGFLKVLSNQVIYLTPGQTFLGIAKYTLYILLASLLNKELIIHVHGNYLGEEYENLNGFKKKIFYFLLSKFNKGIVLSESLRKNLTPFLPKKKIYVLSNFAQEFLVEGGVKKDFSETKIVYLSNLMEEKGILIFLNALKQLEEQKIKYKAKIAGNIDDKLSGKVNQLLSELKNTEYLGVLQGEDKKKLLHWGTIFVLPTYYSMEGQPISIIEAMATKNAIITTKHAGIPDIVNEPKNGYFVEKKNLDDLTNRLVYLSKNKNEVEKIAKENNRYFSINFSEQKFIEKLIKIIN